MMLDMLKYFVQFKIRTAHVGTTANNGSLTGFAALNGNNAPSNRNRNIGDHTILTKLCKTSLPRLCEKLNMIPINRLVRLAPEHLGMRV